MSEVLTPSGDLIVHEPRRHIPLDGPVAQPGTPMHLLQIAVQRGDDLERIQKLMDLQERYEAGEARKAYISAMAAFKADPPTVYKDKDNKQYGSKYTSIGNLVNTVNAALSPHGLSARWDIDQAQAIKVTCIMTHAAGHSESCSMSGAPDTSGQKNPLQQMKSTVTYLKIATFEAITGLASAEGNADDDGHGADKNKLPLAEFDNFVTRIKGATTKEAAKAIWHEGAKACDKLGDRDSAAALKTELLEQAKFIDHAAKVK